MGFYLRKSAKFGPIRLNFSKSGIGVSTGIKGFRFGCGPRGNYIHMGRGGLYYRTTLPKVKNQPKHNPQIIPSPENIPLQSNLQFSEIESADTNLLTDSTSQEMVTEINKRANRMPFWPLFLIPCVVNTQFIPFAIIAAICVNFFIDRPRRKTFLAYAIDEETEHKIQKFYDSFKMLTQCDKIWHVSEQANSRNSRRYNAGASIIIKRSPIKISYGTPKYIKTNVTVPIIPVGKQKLYFFPDKLFICEGKKFALISYENLNIVGKNERFIEDEKVPGDATIVGTTWLYLNNNGTPDKRFKNNRQIPVCLYSAISFRSDTGLNERVQCSQKDIGSQFEKDFRTYLMSGAIEPEKLQQSIKTIFKTI